MADNITIARPYAKAAFLSAKASGLYAEWSSTLMFLAKVVKDGRVAGILQDPTIETKRKSRLIIAIGGEHLNSQVRNLVQTLAKYRRLLYVPELCELYETYREEAERTMRVELTSAVGLEQSMRHKLTTMLSKKLDRQVTINFETNDKLLGGAVIKAKDRVINGSVQGRLAALQDFLVATN